MAKKKTAKMFKVWVKRDHLFSAMIKADTLEEALATAKTMSIDDLLDVPVENIDDNHKFIAVMEA